MGTFIIRPTVLSSGGNPLQGINEPIVTSYFGWLSSPDPPNPTPILDIVNTPNAYALGYFFQANSLPVFGAVGSFYDTLKFGFSGNSIYLDGSPTPISFSGLPSGWTPTAFTFTFNPISPAIGFNASVHSYLQLGSIEGVADGTSLSYPTVPSAFDLINNGCGVRVQLDVTVPLGGAPSIAFGEIIASGTYDIVSSSYTLQNPTIPVKIGDKVNITIPSTGNGTLNGVAQINLIYTDPATLIQHTLVINTGRGISGNTDPTLLIPYLMLDNIIISWVNFVLILEQFQLLFYIPFGFGKFQGPIAIEIVGDGVIFSGSVGIGFLDVYFSDTSGVYTLVDNQVYDVIYTSGGLTTNLKLLMPSNILDDEIYEEDFFNMLTFPRKVLSQNEVNEYIESEDLSIIAVLQPVIITSNVEIPSPYIKTAFLP